MNEQNHPPREEITLEKNGRIALCRCWKSKKFPYCDGAHKQLAENVGPVIVHGPKEGISDEEGN